MRVVSRKIRLSSLFETEAFYLREGTGSMQVSFENLFSKGNVVMRMCLPLFNFAVRLGGCEAPSYTQ